jgi:hypothetical protein
MMCGRLMQRDAGGLQQQQQRTRTVKTVKWRLQ